MMRPPQWLIDWPPPWLWALMWLACCGICIGEWIAAVFMDWKPSQGIAWMLLTTVAYRNLKDAIAECGQADKELESK